MTSRPSSAPPVVRSPVSVFPSQKAAQRAPHAVRAVRHEDGWVAVLDNHRFADRSGVLGPDWRPCAVELSTPAFVTAHAPTASQSHASGFSQPAALTAMLLARKVHAGQVRKYTDNPYSDHLAEVAGVAAAALGGQIECELNLASVEPPELRLLGALNVLRVAEAADGSPARRWTELGLSEDELLSVLPLNPAVFLDIALAVAWLHDSVEDQGLAWSELLAIDPWVALGVRWLSDLEVGNRASRKAQSACRLSLAPGWVQTIKVADLLSNTASIAAHDPKFAYTYLIEKHAVLSVLTRAHPALLAAAWEQWERAWKQVN